MRTPLWLTPLLLSAALAVSACTAVPTAPAAEAPAAEAPAAEAPAAEAPAAEGAYAGVDPSSQTVVWWHQHSGSREEGLLELIAEFNATNEYEITVEAQNQGGYDEIRDKVNSSIAAGELPAALLVGYQNDQSFYQLNDTLVDLNLLMNDPAWGMSAEEIADFYPAFLEQSVNPLFDGQRLGFPPNRSMEVIFYNQSWLEELGFSGPPTTPAEFQEMACAGAAANGDGTGGYILRDDASAVASWTFAFGGDVLTEEGTRYLYNSPATVEAMTFLKGLYDAGCAYFFTEGYPNPQFAARKALFAQGSTSGIPFYGGDLATVAAEQGREPDAWGVAAIPHTTEQPVQNIYGGDVMIAKTTPEQEVAAWLFVKWFTSPEIQARWTGISGYFPTRASTADSFSEVQLGNAQYLQGVALLPFSTYEPQLISYTAVRDAATTAFNEIMQGADIQSTLDTLTTFANEQEETMMAEAK
jgi:multiple sugar transport system substrate-binding protein/sn-glycerol 3-phosphate transport system substrate-binding protein